MCLFFININLFRHVKLEIALAVSTLNYCKIETNNSTGQGLNIYLNLNADVFVVIFDNTKTQMHLDISDSHL